MKLKKWVYKNIFKPVFFVFEPEFIHDFITLLSQFFGRSNLILRFISFFNAYQNPILNQKLWDIDFKNPVGLAAGFDKDGKIYPVMESVGFGFSEIGTVTLGNYNGNPRPRLWRLPKSLGIVVNYGLKNEGSIKIKKRLLKTKKNIPQIISIGRTNSKEVASFDNSVNDYYQCLKFFIEAEIGDIYEINISCPNMFGGESFTDPYKFRVLLQKIFSLELKKPIFIKMPINLDWSEFKKIVDLALEYKVSALVIGNLNKDRKNSKIKDSIPENIKGNISGKPTEDLSNQLISQTYQYCGDKIKIIGVGGIFSAEDAYQKIKMGASLVELVTGMIYEGPQLVGEINRDLTALLKKDGYQNISEAIGKSINYL